jgi:hypothetical protein
MTGHVHHPWGGPEMKATTITLEAQEVMELEAILLDRDREAALKFLKDVVRAKVRSQGSSELDPSKTSGIPT